MGRLAAFNPLTETPHPGVRWETDARLAAAFGTARETMPRAYAVSMGVRF
jgi:hypothetical protein